MRTNRLSVVLILIVTLHVFLFQLLVQATDIPFGLTEKKLEAILVTETTTDQRPDGYPGSLKTQDELSAVGARTNIPVKQTYRLSFYNVGALKGDAFAPALLTIETVATGGGQVVIENPDEQARAKQPTTMIQSKELPEFQTFSYQLRFSGGVDGVFTSLSESPELLNFYGKRVIRLKVTDSGRMVAFDIKGVSISPLQVVPADGFADWVKASTGKDPAPVATPIQTEEVAEEDVQEPGSSVQGNEGLPLPLILAGLIGLMGLMGVGGFWVKSHSGKSGGAAVPDQTSGESKESEQEPSPIVLLELTHPAGASPQVFQSGWLFGARCTVTEDGTLRDISDSVQWSGSGSFEPATGTRSRPVFAAVGGNQIVLTVEHGGQVHTRSYLIQVISSDGYAHVGHFGYAPACVHGCMACPHIVSGPILAGSSHVLIDGMPAARQGDGGNTTGCCGNNKFTIAAGDPQVLIDGRPAARLGDSTAHCESGNPGRIIATAFPEG